MGEDITFDEFSKDTAEFFWKVVKVLGPIVIIVALTLIFL